MVKKKASDTSKCTDQQKKFWWGKGWGGGRGMRDMGYGGGGARGIFAVIFYENL